MSIPNAEGCHICPFHRPTGAGRALLCQRATRRSLRARSIVYDTSTPATSAFIVRSGAVKLCTWDAAGREHLLDLALPGVVLGCEGVFGGPHGATAVALVSTTLCVLQAEDLVHALDDDPQLARKMAAHLHAALLRAREHVVLLGLTGAPARIARHLADRIEPHPEGATVRRVLTLAEVGARTAMSAETVCRVMAEFEATGILRADAKVIHILDEDRLLKLARK